MRRLGAIGFALFMALLSVLTQARADQASCQQFRDNILRMENESVRPPGWIMLDAMLRSQYARDCVQHPTRKPETEYWFRLDGTSTGVKATCIEEGETDCEFTRPDDGAYAATREIGSYCANAGNPSMCALVKRIEADCAKPIDTQERVQCKDILDGRVPNLPPPSTPLPPITDLIGPVRAGAPHMSDAQIWADPGFQRMCQQADENWKKCAISHQNIASMGAGGGGVTGQAGSFFECKQVYQGVLNMCAATKSAALKPPPPVTPASTPKQPEPPKQADAKNCSGCSAPPSQSAKRDMSAKCQQLISSYVAAAQANDGPRALDGYNALKAEGGCGVLDQVDNVPPPEPVADPRFPSSKRATPLTDGYVQPCNADQVGCTQAMRQLEQGTSPEAKSALFMQAVATGLELGAAMANGLAAAQSRGGTVSAPAGRNTDMRSLAAPPIRNGVGQGSGTVRRNIPSDITGTK